MAPRKWMARATSSLPVPLSPETSTGVRVSFSREIMRRTSWMFAEAPMIPSRLSSVLTRSRKNAFFVTKRFFDVVVGAELHGIDGGLNGTMAGHDSDFGMRKQSLCLTQKFDTGLRGELEVGEDQVGSFLLDTSDRGFDAFGLAAGIAERISDRHTQLANALLIGD